MGELVIHAQDPVSKTVDIDVQFSEVSVLNEHVKETTGSDCEELSISSEDILNDLNNDEDFKKEKISTIANVVECHPINLEKLRELSISEGGLINDRMRKKVWPHLMELKHEWNPKPDYSMVKSHKDYNQVVLDVNRTLKRFPPGIEEEERTILMDQLISLIIRVLDQHPHLHYYQGYHDVAITFLMVMGESLGFALVERLSLTHLQDFMQPTMERTSYYLVYLYPVLRQANQNLYDFICKSGVGTMFCLPWLITWYAHTLSNYRDVVRLYDFFLASPRLMPMYIAASIVLFREEDVLAAECDMASQHFVLSQVPDDLPFERILAKASELYSLYPPDDVQEEVEQFIKQRALEEEEEKRKLLERRKYRSLVSHSGFFSRFRVQNYVQNAHPSFKMFMTASIVAVVGIGLYSYYSEASYFKSFFHPKT